LPSDIIAFVVFCRLRDRLTLRDLSEIMLLRGFTVSHECIRQWEAKLMPVMGEVLRRRRHGTGCSSGQSWYVDESVPTNALKEVRGCARDEGRSLGAGGQVQAPNHRKLRRSKAVVVSVTEKARLDLVRYGSERRAKANH
jgi:hypothetical protein